MTSWQQTLILAYAAINLLIFFKALHETKDKQNAFGVTPWLVCLGSFVWGDAVIFSLFWMLSAGVVWLFQDWYLFLLILSLFWVVRSEGETIYWLNQQFSSINRNPINTLAFRSICHNDSVWFVYQIIWQCLTVVFAICAIYFGWAWLQQLPRPV